MPCDTVWLAAWAARTGCKSNCQYLWIKIFTQLPPSWSFRRGVRRGLPFSNLAPDFRSPRWERSAPKSYVEPSRDIAATVGAERLREIMTDLVDRASPVVQRYGGTVDKFTGDGIMALFGAPVALEDHAIRACLAALGIQEETARLAAEVRHDAESGHELRLLHSGTRRNHPRSSCACVTKMDATAALRN